ncbi:hypothetical protein [Billgrantia endophytica]|uniref:Uncharacterized protein n=1 Tax=Billgrantia endophytica TaxID=2033802 RepID=A0A2N7TX10_9GAMM|nr:hypothetical protein [Halomonas endophytica]PMR72728.1 hypothetical protein C1H69_19970 [Halomonas endophytica]
MKRRTYNLYETDIELVLTRDPITLQWLAVACWHLPGATEPIMRPMPPLAATAVEEEAWTDASQWAKNLLTAERADSAGINATPTGSRSTGYVLR